MKILITGGSGYIGSHLIKKIKQYYQDIEITNLDLESCQCHVNYSFIHDIRKTIPKIGIFDCVIHLAALCRVGESVVHPWDYYNTNILGTKNVLEIPSKHVIFASTGSVDTLNSPYSLSKKAAEEIIIETCDNNKNCSIFRFYNVIGNDGFDCKNPECLVFNLKKAAQTGQFNIFGNDYNTKDGTCVRDFIHVNEICNSILLALFKPSNSIENLGSGVGYSIQEVIDRFKIVNNVDFQVNVLPRRQGDAESNVLNNVSSYFSKIYSLHECLKI